MDCTSSSQASIFSKMSSVLILRSSMTHPTCSLKILPTTGIFFMSSLHTSPSITTSFFIFSQSPSKSKSYSYIFMSNTTIDLAITAFFAFAGAFVSFFGLGFSSGSSSPKRSIYSSFLAYSFFAYSFFSSFFSFFSSFFLSFGLNALWDSLGNSFDPMTASVSTME